MRILTICLILFGVNLTNAQNTNDDYLGKISLSVVTPKQSEKYTTAQLGKLQTKIIGLISRYGISGTGYNSNFIITPAFEIYNEEMIEGMRNMTVLTIDLNLFIKQTNNNLIFSTYTASLKGTGYSKEEAINNAISQLNSNDPKVKEFIEEGKKKIIQFYNSKCNDIISEADKYQGMNDYERALAILVSVPTEATPCYEKIKQKSIEVFKKYQNKKCESILLIAKSQTAGKDFANALSTLSTIDPTSSCYNEAKSLINSTESKLDNNEKTQWNRKRELMKDKLELQKIEIQAVRDVAVAYFNRQPSLMESILGFLF